MSNISLDDQVKCLQRELAMRRNVYPKRVAQGRMKQEKSDHEIAAMEACLFTLQIVQRIDADSLPTKP